MSKEIVKTNEWRCLEYCPNCPFKDNGKAMALADGRVDEIKEMLLNDGHFLCHKTAYNLDNNMEHTGKHKGKKMCYGAYKYLLQKNQPNQIMRVAKSFGDD